VSDNDPHWMEHMHMKKGALHQKLGVAPGQKIPAKKMAAAEHSSDPAEKKEASLAATFARYRP
jgi:hypothetical protein